MGNCMVNVGLGKGGAHLKGWSCLTDGCVGGNYRRSGLILRIMLGSRSER